LRCDVIGTRGSAIRGRPRDTEEAMAEVPALYTNWRRVTRTVIASVRANIDLIAPVLQRDFHPESPEGNQVRDHYLARVAALERKVEKLKDAALAVNAERAD